MPLITFFKPLEGVFEKRYKRFFADVKVKGHKSALVCHCTNTGSMRGVAIPGSRALISTAKDPHRKLRYTLEALCPPDVEPGQWVGVNTAMPNKLVREVLVRGLIKEFSFLKDEPERLKGEVKITKDTRLDFAVAHPAHTKGAAEKITYIEVKNVTLAEVQSDGRKDGRKDNSKTAFFPDSVSVRAAKHLTRLSELKKQGHDALVIYVLQRLDCDKILPAAHIDPDYAIACALAKKAGVKTLGLRFSVTSTGIDFAGTTKTP